MIDNVKVIISFGARNGGFELTWALKKEIDDLLGANIAYLDAISLEADSLTKYTWNEDLGIWKMSNENWYEYYEKAMNKSHFMIFLITKEWLDSYYCWQEWAMCMRSSGIIPIFLVSDESINIIENGLSETISSTTGEQLNEDLRNLYQMMQNNLCIILDNQNIPGTYTWECGSKQYVYNALYSISEESTKLILDVISNKLWQ